MTSLIPHPPRSLTASSNLFSCMAFCTNFVCNRWCSQKLPGAPTLQLTYNRKETVTNHFHALHQRQAYGLVTGQADDTGRGVGSGLHQGDHCLDPQPTALKTYMHTAKINAQSPISCLQCLLFIYLLAKAVFTVNIWEWGEPSKHACYHWGRVIITASKRYGRGTFWCCVSGVCRLTSILSNADGVPPRWTWPRTVSLVS